MQKQLSNKKISDKRCEKRHKFCKNMSKIFLGKSFLGLGVHLFLLSFLVDMVTYAGNYAADFDIPSSVYLINIPLFAISLALLSLGIYILRMEKNYDR